jgi:mono/diheme cytochrome c family protein
MKLIKIIIIALSLLVVTTGCTMNMRDQPKRAPLQTSSFFADGRSARPFVANTIARGQLKINDPLLYTGMGADGKLSEVYPFPIDQAMLQRGQERFNIFCSPCHGMTGNGLGMVVQRGMKQPRSFHDAALLTQPPGYFFNVMTGGFNTMYSYASRVPPEDRWAIAAYIKTLQLSQNATENDVPADKKEELNNSETIQ